LFFHHIARIKTGSMILLYSRSAVFLATLNQPAAERFSQEVPRKKRPLEIESASPIVHNRLFSRGRVVTIASLQEDRCRGIAQITGGVADAFSSGGGRVI
jgi:hypothetical protein